MLRLRVKPIFKKRNMVSESIPLRFRGAESIIVRITGVRKSPVLKPKIIMLNAKVM
jgi:hypothetical protein